jgi:hypothetical protein
MLEAKKPNSRATTNSLSIKLSKEVEIPNQFQTNEEGKI